MTIGNDVTLDTTVVDRPIVDGEDAFLAHYLKHHPEENDAPKKEPSDKGEKITNTEVKDDGKPAEEPSEETPEETNEDVAVDDKAKTKAYVSDEGETYTKIKVGDEEHEVPVSQLKRLFGQEASLTQKSQAIAAQQKTVSEDAARYSASTAALLARAEERFAPFAELDFLLLAKDPNISADELSALRTEAQTRFEEVNFLKTEQRQFLAAIKQTQHTALVTQAKAAVKALSDPESPYHIEGWDQKVYDGIRTFALAEGIDQDVINNLVDAPALKIIDMAMKWKASQAKVFTTKVNKTVKSVVKTSRTTTPGNKSTKANVTSAKAQLAKTGSMDDAENAFLALMSKGDD